MIDRNELLAQAADRAVLRGILKPRAALDLVIMYKNDCVIEPENDRVTLNGRDLDDAIVELVKARGDFWRADAKPVDRVSAEVERAALLADHKNWGASEEPPIEKKAAMPRQKNPWSAEGWNLTRQMQLFKADPKAAAEVAAAVGCRIGSTHANPNYTSGDRHVDDIADRPRDTKNPWTREAWNLTQQGALFKKLGAEKAAALAAEAGVRLGATRPA